MNIRWDEVVDRTEFVPSPPVRHCAVPRPDEYAFAVAGSVDVNVWLYGTLSACTTERPITLKLSLPFSVREVLAELRTRCGDGFEQRIVGCNGTKYSFCRIFVNGVPNEDLDSSVHVDSCPPTIEIILVTCTEGG